MSEQISVHVCPVTIGIERADWIILVEIIGAHVTKRNFAVMMARDQLLIEPDRGSARGQSQHSAAARGEVLLDYGHDLIRPRATGRCGVVENSDRGPGQLEY